MLELAGIRYDFQTHPVDGVNISPLLRQSGQLAPRNLFRHYPHYSNPLGRPGGAVPQGDWKLIQFYDDSSIELYNLKDDPGERNNLAGTLQPKAAAMQKLFEGWLDSVPAQRMNRNPNHDPARASMRVRAGAGGGKKN